MDIYKKSELTEEYEMGQKWDRNSQLEYFTPTKMQGKKVYLGVIL